MEFIKRIKNEWKWLNGGEKTFLSVVVGIFLIAILSIAGYVQNIFKLVGLLMTDQPVVFTSEIIIRLIGIFPPVGAIAGWF